MGVLRISLAIALCLLLGLTGQAMAFARGAAPAEDRIVICTGHVYQTVYVDAQGQPTTPPQLCADCLHLFSAVFALHAPLAAPNRFVLALAGVPALAYQPDAIARDYSARAPPRL